MGVWSGSNNQRSIEVMLRGLNNSTYVKQKQPLCAREHIIGGTNQTKKCVYKYDTEQLGKVKALHAAAAE